MDVPLLLPASYSVCSTVLLDRLKVGKCESNAWFSFDTGSRQPKGTGKKLAWHLQNRAKKPWTCTGATLGRHFRCAEANSRALHKRWFTAIFASASPRQRTQTHHHRLPISQSCDHSPPPAAPGPPLPPRLLPLISGLRM